MDTFLLIVSLLVWAALGVFNLWIWQKEKGQANLLMMVGAFALAFFYLIFAFEITGLWKLAQWINAIGAVVFGLGFYVLVKAKVLGNLAALKQKAANLAKPDQNSDKPAS